MAAYLIHLYQEDKYMAYDVRADNGNEVVIKPVSGCHVCAADKWRIIPQGEKKYRIRRAEDTQFLKVDTVTGAVTLMNTEAQATTFRLPHGIDNATQITVAGTTWELAVKADVVVAIKEEGEIWVLKATG